MVGQVHAHDFLFLLESLQDIRLHGQCRRLRFLYLKFLSITEKRGRIILCILHGHRSIIHDVIEERKTASSGNEVLVPVNAEGVERAGVNQ